MRKVEEKKEQEQEGIKITIEEDVKINDEVILEKDDEIVVYPKAEAKE